MKPDKQLYQWDVNQYLTGINPAAQYVDYTIGNEVIRLETDGTRCRIPDEVLQTYGGKTCYERYPDGTYRAYSFTVLYAPKPPNYVFTPEERTTFEALTARVDAAIDEIKRRADSGEFTPVKGVDYFTDAEKNEMMESVSSGAVGEFRKVVDTATTEYNDNASEKLTTYDTNAEQHTSDYNRNAEVKLEAYNQNHTEKVAEYNQNAETKTEEFDANAAALQTEVDRLRGECDNLAEENRKQENRIDALIKLNKGQTYDVIEQESEAYSVDVPSGSRYMGIDKVGGHSEVIDGEIVSSQTDRVDIKGANIWDDEVAKFTNFWTRDGKVYRSSNTSATYVYQDLELDVGTYTISAELISFGNDKMKIQFRDLRGTVLARLDLITDIGRHSVKYAVPKKGIYRVLVGGTGNGSLEFSNIMLTKSSDSEYKPYSLQHITTSFPVLNSSRSVYDYIDLNEGKLYTWTYIEGNEVKALTEPVITDIDIPTELTDWLTVEAGGSVTFHNSDESKQLPVPNAVSWVRKLNEVE